MVETPTEWRRVLYTIAGITAALLALFFGMPAIVMAYYKRRARGANTSERKAYWTYRTASFYLHQLGCTRGRLTPMQYAREVIDPALGTSLTSFMNVYLKVKYAKQPLTAIEAERISGFLPPFFAQVRSRIGGKKRLAAFLSPIRTIAFFVQPGDDETTV